jgi:transposase
MKKIPITIRPLTEAEQAQLRSGLRSPDVFVVRRSQMLLANAAGETAPVIARRLGCDDETVRLVLKDFNRRGLAVLQAGSRRPHHIQVAFPGEKAAQLKTLLHESPRKFGKPTSVWTLALAAEVSFAQGLTATLVSAETIRGTLQRLGVGWRRAKHWITSPDPAYQQKKGGGIG